MLSGNSILILAPLSITCIFTGILGSTFGVGGGFIIVPVLNFLLSIFLQANTKHHGRSDKHLNV